MSEYTNPVFRDPDDVDLTPAMAQAAIDRFFDVGPQRERELNKVLKPSSNGNYQVPHATLDYGSDFYDHANYTTFSEKYPWLTYCYLDPDKYNYEAKQEKDTPTWYEFLAGIDQDLWTEFLEDIESVRNDPCGFSGDLAFELEQKETDRYWKEDAHWDLLNEICAKLKNSFHQYVVRRMTPDETWEIARAAEIYPEAQGEGSVYVKTEDIAAEFDFDMWTLEHDIKQYETDWVNEKRRAWSLDHRAIFEKALTHAVAGDEQKQALLHDASDSDLFRLMVSVVPDQFGISEELRWRFWGWQTEEKNRWYVGRVDTKSTDSPATAIEFGMAVAAQRAAERMVGTTLRLPPLDHPELQFEAKKASQSFDDEEDWDIQKAQDWIAMGGYDSAKQIYHDENVRVIIPITFSTLKKYVPEASTRPNYSHQQRTSRQEMDVLRNDGEVFVVIPHAFQAPTDYGIGPYMVQEKEGELKTNWSRYSFAQQLENKKEGPSVRKAFLQWYRKKIRSDFESNFPYLMQLGGFKAIQRHLHKLDDIETSRALDFKIGFAAARAGNLVLAAKYLQYDAKLLTPGGFYALYDDWDDLTSLFDREYRGTAEKVFSSDMDWLSQYVWDQEFPIDSLTDDLSVGHYDQIRETLLWRMVPAPEDVEADQVPLTREMLEALTDEQIKDYIKDTELEDFEPYREAIESGVKDAYLSNLESAWVNAYQEAITDQLGASSWQKYQGKDKLAFLITWAKAQECLDTHNDEHSYEFEDSLRDLLDYAGTPSVQDEYDARYDENEEYLDECISTQLGEIDAVDYPEDPNQLQLGIYAPSSTKKVPVRFYSEHYPEGYSARISELEYERLHQTEPWRLNKEAYDAYTAQQAAQPTGAPPAPGLGESVDFFWATIFDSDSADSLMFDASPYFKVAPVERIRQLEADGWRGFRADEVAWEAAKKNNTLGNFMEAAVDGFTVQLNPADATKALNQRLADEGMSLVPFSELEEAADPDEFDPKQVVLDTDYVWGVAAVWPDGHEQYMQKHLGGGTYAFTGHEPLAKKLSPADAKEIADELQRCVVKNGIVYKPVVLGEGAAYKYGCAMVALPEGHASFIIQWGQANIPDELIWNENEDGGREKEIHTTAKYGFVGNPVEQLHDIGDNTAPFPIYIGAVSLFQQADHDVVKLDVESPWLHKLNAALSRLPNKDKYPVYKPHITVAYVQKGSCDHLVGDDLFAAEGSPGAEFIATNMDYQGATEDSDDPNRPRAHILFSKPKLEEAKEQIKACAIRMKDGRVITGRLHGDCLGKAQKLGLIGEMPEQELPYEVYDIEPGFVTNTNRFLNREEAYHLAVATGLVPDEGEMGQLHGSDVWESVDPDEVDPLDYATATLVHSKMRKLGFMWSEHSGSWQRMRSDNTRINVQPAPGGFNVWFDHSFGNTEPVLWSADEVMRKLPVWAVNLRESSDPDDPASFLPRMTGRWTVAVKGGDFDWADFDSADEAHDYMAERGIKPDEYVVRLSGTRYQHRSLPARLPEAADPDDPQRYLDDLPDSMEQVLRWAGFTQTLPTRWAREYNVRGKVRYAAVFYRNDIRDWGMVAYDARPGSGVVSKAFEVSGEGPVRNALCVLIPEAPVQEAADPDDFDLEKHYVKKFPTYTFQAHPRWGLLVFRAMDMSRDSWPSPIGYLKEVGDGWFVTDINDKQGNPAIRLSDDDPVLHRRFDTKEIAAQAIDDWRMANLRPRRQRHVEEAADPDDINPQQYLATTKMPVYYELFLDMPQIGMWRIWFNTVGSPSSKPERLIYDEALLLQQQLQPHYAVPLQVRPAEDQSQMYWQGRRWPEDFYLEGGAWRNKPKVTEAMPNVDALYRQLVARLQGVLEQCLPDVEKCIKTAAADPVLSSYVRLAAGSKYNTTKGQYLGVEKRVLIGVYAGIKPSDWQATLKHELVHRAQHEHSNWEKKGGYGSKTRRIKAAMQRAAVQNHGFEQKWAQNKHLSSEDAKAQLVAREAYDANMNKFLPAYYDEPSEAQAHAVEVAAELQGDPQWKERLRAGAKDTDKGKAYAKHANVYGRKRMLKNAYQAMTQESADPDDTDPVKYLHQMGFDWRNVLGARGFTYSTENMLYTHGDLNICVSAKGAGYYIQVYEDTGDSYRSVWAYHAPDFDNMLYFVESWMKRLSESADPDLPASNWDSHIERHFIIKGGCASTQRYGFYHAMVRPYPLRGPTSIAGGMWGDREYASMWFDEQLAEQMAGELREIGDEAVVEPVVSSVKESADPDAPESYVKDYEKRFAVYIDRGERRVFQHPDGYLTDAPAYMPLKDAVRWMSAATKAGNPVKLLPEARQQEAEQPFAGLPFPAEPGQLNRFKLRKNMVSKLLS